MARRLAILCIFVGVALLGVILLEQPITHAQDGGHGDTEHGGNEVLRGSAVYAEFCAACHGPEGEAIGTGPSFAAIRDYDVENVRDVILEGYDTDPSDTIRMPGYEAVLAKEQVDYLLAFMATWNDPETETPHLPEPNLSVETEVKFVEDVDPEHGAEIYAYSCLGCHGLNAEGRDEPGFPGFELDEERAVRVAATGEEHGPVPAFSRALGGPLSTEDLADLGAYLRTLEAREEEEEQPEGIDWLIIFLGLGAIGLVGLAYMGTNPFARKSEGEGEA